MTLPKFLSQNKLTDFWILDFFAILKRGKVILKKNPILWKNSKKLQIAMIRGSDSITSHLTCPVGLRDSENEVKGRKTFSNLNKVFRLYRGKVSYYLSVASPLSS
jgi:hypothetical protein